MKLDSKDTDRLYKLYIEYFTLHENNTHIGNCIKQDITIIEEKGKEILSQLDVDYSIEDIENNFTDKKVIQLRDVKKCDHLLIGCGNTPLKEGMGEGSYMHDQDHSHIDSITINPSILMNPTVVAAFSFDKGLKQILPLNHYTEIQTEAVTIANKIEDIDQDIFLCLKKDFKTFEIQNTESKTKISLEESELFWNREL